MKAALFISFLYFYISSYSQNSNALSYHILLLKQNTKSSYFNKYHDNELYNIRSYKTKDGSYIYVAGKFDNTKEALKLLNEIQELGIENAKLITNTELLNLVGAKYYYTENIEYTIQLKRSKTKLPENYFGKLENVSQLVESETNYIYTYGKFKSYKTAKNYWHKIISYGYDEAFIINIDRYSNNYNN